MAEERNAFEWAILPIRKYADFNGRAPRAEYWWYMLAIMLIGVAAELIDGWISDPIVGIYGPASLIITVTTFVPGISVMVRRLHDIGRSGWWALLNAGSYTFVVMGFTNVDPEQLVDGLDDSAMIPVLVMVLVWLVSIVVMLIFMVTRGEDGANRYGDDPYGPARLEEVFA